MGSKTSKVYSIDYYKQQNPHLFTNNIRNLKRNMLYRDLKNNKVKLYTSLITGVLTYKKN